MMITKIFAGIKEILYPSVCRCCGTKLDDRASFICDQCLSSLPVSGQYLYPKEANFVREKLKDWEIDNCCCYFLYDKNSTHSNIIKEIKFGSDIGLGKFMGEMFGKVLSTSGKFGETDIVIPIPLHHKRLRKRGYNQSEIIASAIAHSLGTEMCTTAIERIRNTLPQSKRSTAADRRSNMIEAFRISNAEKINGKHILLVDDVITTGETMKATISCIKTYCANVRISVAALSAVKQVLMPLIIFSTMLR